MLCEELPEAADTFNYILSRYSKLRKLIDTPPYTLTYNDFYWTNFIVRKDKREALMFDYNLLGRGYRYSDFRNVCWSMSEEAGMTFVDTYKRLYVDKYGTYRTAAEEATEKQIDDVMDCLHGLTIDLGRKNFSKLAEFVKNESVDGTLLKQAKKLLE
jgi:aminoglycoside phosphotransferase